MSKLVKSVSAEERKFLRKAFWRSATLYAAVSPAKQGASGFCYSLMPALNHFYITVFFYLKTYAIIE